LELKLSRWKYPTNIKRLKLIKGFVSLIKIIALKIYIEVEL